MVSLFGRFIRLEFAANRGGDQVIIGVADNLHARKLSERQPATDINTAIDVGRVGFATGHEVSPFELASLLIFAAN